jgi:hypothetical protein
MESSTTFTTLLAYQVDSELLHYDAAQRREYYLRNRHLKGRTKGTAKVAAPRKTRAQRQADRRKHLEARVAELKSRLERLRDVLAAEVKEAKARSGVKPATEPKKAASTQPKTSGNSEKLTSQQKAAKAKADKKRREKDQTLDEQVKSLTEKIKTIQERIAKMRKDGSVGVKRNTAK